MGKVFTKFSKFTELVRFDWFIKNMFRNKADFDILEGFLSELLREDITIIEILESEGNQTHKKDKFNRVDVMVKTSKEERIIVEVQNNEEYDYLQRILFGASKTITENIKRGDAYSQVKKVISVSIVYFEVGQGFDYIYHGTTTFRGIHKNDELALTAEQKELFQKDNPTQIYPEYYLINALSFPDVIQESLDEWVYFFKNSKIEDNFQAKGMGEAKEKLAVAKLSKRKRTAYEQYLTELHDEASWNETKRMKQEMQEKKLKEATENARLKTIVVIKAILQGLDVKLIAEQNDISIEAVLEIKSELESK
jgi:predicted transposase/invertase (TIGR01784 family)